MLGSDFNLLFEKIIISVLDGLKSMFHLDAQALSCNRSKLSSVSKVLTFLDLFRRATSSAKRYMSDLMFSSMSFRYTRNNSEDNIEPWGTEPKISRNSDDFPHKTTL